MSKVDLDLRTSKVTVKYGVGHEVDVCVEDVEIDDVIDNITVDELLLNIDKELIIKFLEADGYTVEEN